MIIFYTSWIEMRDENSHETLEVLWIWMFNISIFQRISASRKDKITDFAWSCSIHFSHFRWDRRGRFALKSRRCRRVPWNERPALHRYRSGCNGRCCGPPRARRGNHGGYGGPRVPWGVYCWSFWVDLRSHGFLMIFGWVEVGVGPSMVDISAKIYGLSHLWRKLTAAISLYNRDVDLCCSNAC